jgi:hypothetical protein
MCATGVAALPVRAFDGLASQAPLDCATGVAALQVRASAAP